MVAMEIALSIFSGVYSSENGEDTVRIRRQVLVSNFNSNIFFDEFSIFYSIMKKYPTLSSLNERFITLYLNSHKSEISRSKNVDLNRFASSEDSFKEFTASCLSLFKQFQDSKAMDDSTFMLYIESYRMEYLNVEGVSVLQDGATILSDGMKVGRRTLSGFDDMASYVKTNFIRLDAIKHGTSEVGIVTYGVDDTESMAEPLNTICQFGIKPLDDTFGGITEGDMISVLGITKAGKSRLMTFLIHQALISGVSCVVWAAEGGREQFESLIRACHFAYLYSNGSNIMEYSPINSDAIRKGVLTGALKDKEEASWLDLKTNVKYGKLTVISAPFELGSYLETLDIAVKKTGAKLVGVDYLQLIREEAGVKPRSVQERVSDAYIMTLQYLKANKVAGIFPAQIKQTSIKEIGTLSREELDGFEVRDTAGVSYEVIKTPDINIALLGGTNDIKDGRVYLKSCPSRNASMFPTTTLAVDFGSCTYTVAEES